MKKERLAYLLMQYSNDLADAAEREELFSYLAAEESKEPFTDLVADFLLQHEQKNEDITPFRHLAFAAAAVDRDVFEEIPSDKPVQKIFFLRRAWLRYAAALIILTGIAVMAILMFRNSRSSKQEIVATPENILPGSDKAILTLADGSTIALDTVKAGLMAMQGQAQIEKKEDGQIVYNGTNAGKEIMMNTLSTPRGGQYRLLLPDGTEVWLNAASSIRYPASFAGNERRVTITGEAYFDVAKNKSKPFFVDIDGKAFVEVLGTSFNINAYSDEPVINTALLEGTVRMMALTNPQKRTQSDKTEPSNIVLRPGQQASIDKSGIMKVDQAERSIVMAWREGVFRYNYTDFDVVLRQLSRWYDIDVQYEKGIPDQKFTGEIRRDYTLSQALSILEGMDVHFRLEGKKLIVLP
jgi:transmembrane sensor